MLFVTCILRKGCGEWNKNIFLAVADSCGELPILPDHYLAATLRGERVTYTPLWTFIICNQLSPTHGEIKHSSFGRVACIQDNIQPFLASEVADDSFGCSLFQTCATIKDKYRDVYRETWRNVQEGGKLRNCGRLGDSRSNS